MFTDTHTQMIQSFPVSSQTRGQRICATAPILNSPISPRLQAWLVVEASNQNQSYPASEMFLPPTLKMLFRTMESMVPGLRFLSRLSQTTRRLLEISQIEPFEV